MDLRLLKNNMFLVDNLAEAFGYLIPDMEIHNEGEIALSESVFKV